MGYADFVHPGYRPLNSELVCLFRITPAKGISMREASGRVASESSNGTWTDVSLRDERIVRLGAKAFETRGGFVKIAYPAGLFEPGNMPQILSSIAGNIFGMKAVSGLRLEDVAWPRKILKSFMGPQFGIKGIRKMFRVYGRPLTATVPKPKVGMTSEEHARTGYEAWVGGLDLLKDDENLSSQSFNKFERRVEKSFGMRDRAEKETGEIKSYLVNVSAETEEMLRRARFVKKHGGEYVMVDALTVGWAAVQTLRRECEDLGLAMHMHRAMHAAMDRNPLHGISMLALSTMSRLVGVDQLHIGTVVGKLVSPRGEVKAVQDKITSKKSKKILNQNWENTKPVLPTSSGGLHPGLVPDVMKIMGRDIVIQAGGGVHGHPGGTRAGAAALLQAVESVMENVSLSEYSKNHAELRKALEHWGRVKPV
ncbi:MAG: type III ribulose-bisphosphate carboxylase [Candidatus Aenigmarchaeota archaeon]|nr:type III ribulose-bisphosphate carboxylase [Candidatus Aenigmarchaeota archaeon]